MGGGDTSVELQRAIMGELLAETLALMSKLEHVAETSAATKESPIAAAAMLRLSTRLAAVGGWLLTQDGEGVEPLSPSETARRSDMLRRAQFGPLDVKVAPPLLSDIARRIDRLVTRALRIDQSVTEVRQGAASQQNALRAAASIYSGSILRYQHDA